MPDPGFRNVSQSAQSHLQVVRLTSRPVLNGEGRGLAQTLLALSGGRGSVRIDVFLRARRVASSVDVFARAG